MTAYFFPIFLTIFANILYHVCQRSIAPQANPVISLIATYMVAIACCAAAFPLFSGGFSAAECLRKLNWASYALGAAIIGLEIGFLLAYREGWNLSTAVLYSNVAVTLLLVPVGLAFYNESLTVKKALGMGLAVISLILMSLK